MFPLTRILFQLYGSSLCVSRDVSNSYHFQEYQQRFALREQGCFYLVDKPADTEEVRSA